MANDLRGSVDGWDFKQYVLGMLFYRYISENITAYINAGEWEAGNADFDYAKLTDEEAEQAREDLVRTKGFFILPSELFQNVRARAKEDQNLNETLERVFKNIEASAIGTESERNLKGLFDDFDVNSNKLGTYRLTIWYLWNGGLPRSTLWPGFQREQMADILWRFQVWTMINGCAASGSAIEAAKSNSRTKNSQDFG